MLQLDLAFNRAFVLELDDLLLDFTYCHEAHVDEWLEDDVRCRTVRM